MFDEPVNGLDPEGIRWIRTLLRSLAAEGRTVFVSSHLMSEMALTAQHLVVIGRGRLIADASVTDLIERSEQRAVRVRSPQLDVLHRLLEDGGRAVETTGDGALDVRDADAADVGELAAAHGLVLHELVARRPSLEEAFMELTDASVEFAGAPHASVPEEGAA
jgi:ABC-2 type transport system ATP-binding protein